MYCTKCGSENSDDSKFCSNCGNNLEQTSSGVFPAKVQNLFMRRLRMQRR